MKTDSEILTELRGMLATALIEVIQPGEEVGALRFLCRRQAALMQDYAQVVMQKKNIDSNLLEALQKQERITDFIVGNALAGSDGKLVGQTILDILEDKDLE